MAQSITCRKKHVLDQSRSSIKNIPFFPEKSYFPKCLHNYPYSDKSNSDIKRKTKK